MHAINIRRRRKEIVKLTCWIAFRFTFHSTQLNVSGFGLYCTLSARIENENEHTACQAFVIKCTYFFILIFVVVDDVVRRGNRLT